MTEWEEALGPLLAQAGCQREHKLTPLSGGANNRVFRVEAGEKSFLLKSYFHHPQDPRDRLEHEFSFCRFAWNQGLRSVPEPLARDSRHQLGLYEFIPGRKIRSSEITAGMVEEALAFYEALNARKETPEAKALPLASEACFSLSEHLACVDKRVERLKTAAADPRMEQSASTFITQTLSVAWKGIRDKTKGDDILKETDRALSPSDFGFHNAILTKENRLRFVDFEYSGWDDPAKMVCDFFSQPDMPVSEEHWKPFLERVFSRSSNPSEHHRRTQKLLPVYRVKWSCILLNEFLPMDAERRRFAKREAPSAEQGARQLEKARRMLERAQETHGTR